MCQNGHEEPFGGDNDRHTDVWSALEAQECGATHVDFSELCGRLVGEVLVTHLVEAVIELQLGNHEETLLNGKLLHLFALGELTASFGSSDIRIFAS